MYISQQLFIGENKQGEITKFLTLDEKESIITGCVDSSSLILVVRTQIKNVFHYELRRYDENGKLVSKKEISNLGFPYTVFVKIRNCCCMMVQL